MTILINPPPSNHRCHCCNKKTDLHKTFRQQSGTVGASFECKDCIGLSNKEYLKKKEEN